MQRPQMLILFDHGTPRSIARWLHGHIVVEAVAKGWDRLANGALLKAAEEAGFDVPGSYFEVNIPFEHGPAPSQ